MSAIPPIKMKTTALAYMGDAVYEVRIRKMLLERGIGETDRLHREAVKYVSAAGQAKAVRAMLERYEASLSGNTPEGLLMTGEEAVLVKRARNHRAMSRPKNADPVEYKLATGFEAWLGYLFLTDDLQRMNDVVDEAVRLIDEP